ncbi:hypothetical protein HDU78_010728 [Chytriomyces hyalinus]|nr:hypothetical protein HDU78_010728 [Chytriomyces hyalinus]
MPLHSLYIINKAGGLIYQKDYTDGVSKLSSNEYLVLAGTFHSIHVISSKLSPVPSSSGIEVLESDLFKMFCIQTPTGTKFLLITDPIQGNVDAIMRKIYEAYSDFVMKNPFYTPEMPIRAELFDLNLNKIVKQINSAFTHTMILNVKRNTDTLFLMELPVSTPTEDVLKQVTAVHNMKLRLTRLIDAANDISLHGLMKPENEHGYSIEELEELKGDSKPDDKVGQVFQRDGFSYIYNPDPTGRRTGEAPLANYSEIIQTTLESARELVSKEFWMSNKFLTIALMDEAINNISGALTIAYPMGMPDFEPAKEAILDMEELAGTAVSKEVVAFEDASLWWANKEITLGKLLSDFVGKNDKTKVIIKLQKKSQGAPVRESPLDEQAQKQMMAFYYKKQEEHKKLMENNDDEFLHSSWANPKSLKSSFNGVSNVSWRPN